MKYSTYYGHVSQHNIITNLQLTWCVLDKSEKITQDGEHTNQPTHACEVYASINSAACVCRASLRSMVQEFNILSVLVYIKCISVFQMSSKFK